MAKATKKTASRRRFDQAFKIAAVNRVLAGEGLKNVATNVKVNPTLLSRWKAEITRGGLAGKTASTKAKKVKAAKKAPKRSAAKKRKAKPAAKKSRVTTLSGTNKTEIKSALRAELSALQRDARSVNKKIARVKAALAVY